MHSNLRSVAATLLVLASSLGLHARQSMTAERSSDPPVTAVAGESWLRHLHRSFGETSMGKTGRLGPPAIESGAATTGAQLGLVWPSSQTVAFRGADLYRVNCQGCHGDEGLGAPPEINSVINPVRATSIPLVVERMKKSGMDITPAAAAELAKQSQDALLQRLHNGGQAMPAFPHLSEGEIRALIAYLKQLAGVPGAGQLTVTESPIRIGEHIVKSTCHTCHDATGPNPTPQQLENGAIPPLETLPARVDELQFVHKVTRGAPIVMGTPSTPHRGRMPVFYYLTPEEAGDVYLYLVTYPPALQAKVEAVAATQQQAAGSGPSQPPPMPQEPLKATGAKAPERAAAVASGIPDWMVTVFLAGLGIGLMGLIGAGVAFAAYELYRLGEKAKRDDSHSLDVTPIDQDVHDLVVR